jgi:lipid II:glycine glycyltransferase (peptidoglycan interpeptide bridge formation enzyme)
MGAISGSKLIKHEGRTFEVCWNDEPNDPAWDDFVVSVPDGHHEQTSLWGQVRARYGWEIARYTLKENGRIVAGAQAQVRTIGRFGKVAYLTYAPCIGSEEELVVEVCLKELKKFFSGLGVMLAVVGLPYHAHGLVQPLERSGFFRKPNRLHPHFMEATLVLDLSKQPEEILAEMRMSTRKHVRNALRKGITVVEGEVRDIDMFYELMLSLCERRKTTPSPSQADFFHHLWKNFSPKGWMKLFIARNGQEPVSATIAFPFGDWFRVWKIGWNGQYGNFRPNEALWWAMIQYARNNGYRYFDFVDIDPVQARAALNGKDPLPSSANTTFFKLGFGGEIKLLPAAYCYFLNPALRLVMQCGLGRFLDSGIAQRLSNVKFN